MPQVCWQSAPNGRYWLDILVANQWVRLMLDMGLVDGRNWVACEVRPDLYDQLKAGGQFRHIDFRSFRDASGGARKTECGLTTAQMIDPNTRLPAGPQVLVYVSRGTPGVPSRVGVVFFHRLIGCRVVWELGQREWCVEYP